jgi:2-polyprenyl-3-methyl-5-hydroxy-6-metoxy-1,4-benzoquinol methylase
MSPLALTAPAGRAALVDRRPSIRERAGALAPWLVETTLPIFGLGPIVDVGCGDTTLARAFGARGVSTSVVDLTTGIGLAEVKGPIEAAFFVHVLEWLAADDLASFLRDVHDAVDRDVFVVVDTRGEGGGVLRPREWWENQLFDAGFARHPLSLNLTPYEALEKEGDVVLLAARRLADTLLEKCPGQSLVEERSLHMDMLRETGRRADAHLARYALASTFVRPHDRVLDAACGLGYGAAMLTEGTLAESVVGIDSSPRAIEYARLAYGVSATFECRQVSSLASAPAGSLDLVASFETVEHIDDPDTFLRDACRALTPGGRFICSVPNRWVDETGRDPNPYHLHVFDRSSILDLCRRYFRIERLFGQTAGGGMKASATIRRWREVEPTADDGSDPEWWVVVAMKEPLPEPSSPYRESLSAHPACGEWTITAFERYYENPWLVRALVSRGIRATSSALLTAMARDTLDRSSAFSADTGAALCVLAYAQLGSTTVPRWLSAALRSYCLAPDGNPHVERWRISNEYALARVELESGRIAEARDLFERCAGRDCLRFSPLLATKTIDAAFWAGWLAMQVRDTAGAGRWWTRGLEEARRVMAADWTNVIGSIEEPLLFGMRELTDVADVASRCASGLHLLTEFADRPGVAASQTWRSLGGLLQGREYELALTRKSVSALQDGLEASRRRVEELTSQLRAAREQRLRSAAGDPRGIAIFGAGQGGRRFAELWRQRGGVISCFLDNDPASWQTSVDGIAVSSPARLSMRDVPLVVVASVAHAAIAEQLTRMNLVAERDFICWVDAPGADGHRS